jgi:hypothetical protein
VFRIAAGDAAHSGIVGRMARRGEREQMPPLGTEELDPAGLVTVSSWIASLTTAACPPADSCPLPAPAPK